MTENIFNVGEKVKIVRKGCGTEYYYSHPPLKAPYEKGIPLGSHGIVASILGRDMVYVKMGDTFYSFSNCELDYYKEESGNNPKEESELLNLLESEEPSIKKSSEKERTSPFNPRFNVREEFAIWVREEFPHLKGYAREFAKYEDLTQRKQEVMEAAQKAIEHIRKEETRNCALDLLAARYSLLEDCTESIFSFNLDNFISQIEKMSVSLHSKLGRHYGTILKGLGGIS